MKKQMTKKKLVLAAETLSQMQLAQVAGGTGYGCPASNISGCQTKPVGSCPDNAC